MDGPPPTSFEGARMLLQVLAYAAARIQRLRADGERGATAVEYGLLVGLIAVVVIGAVTTLGGNLDDIFDGVATDLAP